MKHLKQLCFLIGSAAAVGSTQAAQVIATDLVVQGSTCSGFDCVNGESFGFDTIRLKENNLRIHFQDTSNSASFPTADWRLVANDTSNGGANYFGIEDSDRGTIPFRVESGARNHALVVEADGHVGIGTIDPVVNLHIKEGNTATLRLEQDGSSGFTPQTWDLAGNETNFFIRDASNSSQLPFRIKPGSGNGDALVISANGDIGLGTASPGEKLDVRGDGNVRFALTATDGDKDTWVFNHNAGQDAFIINYANSPTSVSEFKLTQAGDLTISGSLTTQGTTCSGGCDAVFTPEYDMPSIEEHAEAMWENKFLPGVGQTIENEPFNLTVKTGGMLNELEKAHIYIEQLHTRLEKLEKAMSELKK